MRMAISASETRRRFESCGRIEMKDCFFRSEELIQHCGMERHVESLSMCYRRSDLSHAQALDPSNSNREPYFQDSAEFCRRAALVSGNPSPTDVGHHRQHFRLIAFISIAATAARRMKFCYRFITIPFYSGRY